ncbi:hypothetical protein CHUAL_011761 [Chamberlinius hualienensis]
MNYKVRPESFAQSLQGKLQYLSHVSGSYNDEQNSENDVVDGSARTAADSAVKAQPSSSVNTGEFDHLLCNERTHLNANDVSRVQNYAYNSESSTTTNIDEFDHQHTINNSDEIDLGFCSQESSNELPRHPSTPSPDSTSIDGHCDSSAIDYIINAHHINNDVDESGCISSVSSTLTDQDNEDDNFNFKGFTSDLSDGVTSSPKPTTSHSITCWSILTDISLLHNHSFESNCNSSNSGNRYSLNNLTTCVKPEDAGEGTLPIANIIEENQPTVSTGDTPNVVEIKDCTATENSSITFKTMTHGINDKNWQLIIPSSNEIDGLTSDNKPTELLVVTNGDGHLQVDCKGNSEHDENHQLKVVPNTHLTDEPNTHLNLSELHRDSTKVETPEDDFPVRVRRCSSLRTGKTPPGTPDRKKIVRFADAMGLDLEDIKTVFLDDLPVVPVSAYKDLDSSFYDDDDLTSHDGDCDLQLVASHHTNAKLPFDFEKQKTNLVPVFPQPGSLPDFFDRLRRQSVCLESAVVTGCSTITLAIRVVNLGYNKVVSVRYTSNEWKDFQDAIAEYVENSNDIFSDKFRTVINSEHLQVGERLCFAICFKMQGKEYWDNNGGQNYIFQCFLEHDRHLSPHDDSWIHFL